MPTGQVSVWIPIVVGIIGVVGVISGQLVNAWREDGRWKREQEREDVRWQREVHKGQEMYLFEKGMKIRELRLQTYGELLVTMAKIESNLVANINMSVEAVSDLQSLHAQNQNMSEGAAQILAKIQLISTGNVEHAATILKEWADPQTYYLMSVERNEDGVVDVEGVTNTVFIPFNRCHERFVKAARAELET